MIRSFRKLQFPALSCCLALLIFGCARETPTAPAPTASQPQISLGGQDGGGAASTQYAGKTLEQITWGFVLGIKFSRTHFGAHMWDWKPADIADVISKAEISEIPSFRMVDGRKRELMMDYQSDGHYYSYNPERDKLIVRPPMVSMIGFRAIRDMSGTELKRIKIAYLKETAHLMGWGIKPDGSDDNIAQERAEEIYDEMESDLEICLLPTARDGSNAAYLINPSLGLWMEYPIDIKGKQNQDKIYTAAYESLTHIHFAQLMEAKAKPFFTFGQDKDGILGDSNEEVLGLTVGEGYTTLSFLINYQTHSGKIKGLRTGGKEISVACGSFL